MSFKLEDGTPIIGSYFFGDELKTGIGFIKLVGETWHAYLALKDGGTTQQELFRLTEYKKIPFALDEKGQLITLE